MQAVNIDSTIPMFRRIGDLRVRSWSQVIENLAIHVLLRRPFIDHCIRRIFPSERLVVSRSSLPVSIFWSLRTENLLSLDTSIPSVESAHTVKSSDVDHEKEEEKFQNCQVPRQIKIPLFRKVAVNIRFHGERLLLLGTSPNIPVNNDSRLPQGEFWLYSLGFGYIVISLAFWQEPSHYQNTW